MINVNFQMATGTHDMTGLYKKLFFSVIVKTICVSYDAAKTLQNTPDYSSKHFQFLCEAPSSQPMGGETPPVTSPHHTHNFPLLILTLTLSSKSTAIQTDSHLWHT
jgi:hypothetical protein